MAEKQFALGGNRGSEFFADDDPLAELARIVGFEPKPVAKRPLVQPVVTSPDVAADEPVIVHSPDSVAEIAPEPIRIEPPSPVAQTPVSVAPVASDTPSQEFDLEDELLREFELYDAPSRRAATTVPAPAVAVSQPRPTENRARAEQDAISQAFSTPVAVQPPQPAAVGGEFDDDFASMFADDAPSVAAPVQDVASPVASARQVEPTVGVAVEPQLHAAAFAPAEPQLSITYPAPDVSVAAPGDLADELEQSISSVVDAPDVMSTSQSSASLKDTGNPSRFRLPLANFNAAAATPRVVEPQLDVLPDSMAAGSPVPSVGDLGFYPEHDRHEPVVSVDHDTTLRTDAVGTAFFEEPVPAKADVSPSVDFEPDFDLGDLLDNIEGDPLPVEGPVQVTDIEIRREPAFVPTISARAPEVESISKPVLSHGNETFSIAPAVVRAPVVEDKLEDKLEDAFEASDFELDLDDIELELSDLDFDADIAPPPVATVARPSVVEPVRTSFERPVAAAPVAVPPVSAVSPSAMEAGYYDRKPAFEETTPVDSHAFDPSLLTDSEERLESISDLHVPHLPVSEPEEPIAPQPEYDLDLDAEMASLFGHSNVSGLKSSDPVAASPVSANFAQQEQWATAPVSSAQQDKVDDFDEFERALEEDFRRTFSEPLGQDSRAAKLNVQSSGHLAVPGRRRSGRGWMLMAGVACILLLGGAGAYAWLHKSGGMVASSSGPRVIAADAEPVKVEPENRGGKTVPNQDKAVYDRVAGNATDTPTQNTLVSSNEQPVDVVQKTLIPENMPSEGAEDTPAPSASTPVGDTQDERLLPGDQQVDTAQPADSSDPAAGVAPRKVRTMIVKADGTLVPREDTPATEAAVQPQLAAPSTDASAALAAGSAIATGVPPETAAKPVDTQVAATVPVKTVKTTGVTDTTPIPTARPSDQAVNIVGTVSDKGNVRPTAAADATGKQVAQAQAVSQTTSTPVASGTYVMQVASLPSEEEAKRSYASLSSKFGSIVGGRGVDIRKVEIPGKGTFYRVRIPVGTKDDAANLCVKLRSAGGTCLVSK